MRRFDSSAAGGDRLSLLTQALALDEVDGGFDGSDGEDAAAVATASCDSASREAALFDEPPADRPGRLGGASGPGLWGSSRPGACFVDAPSWVAPEDLPMATHLGPVHWRRDLDLRRTRHQGDVAVTRELLMVETEFRGRVLTAQARLYVMDGSRITRLHAPGALVDVTSGLLRLEAAKIDGDVNIRRGVLLLAPGAVIGGDVTLGPQAQLRSQMGAIEGRLRLTGSEARLGIGTFVGTLCALPSPEESLDGSDRDIERRTPMTVVLGEGVRIGAVEAQRPLTLIAHRDAVIERELPRGVTLRRDAMPPMRSFTFPAPRLLMEPQYLTRLLALPSLADSGEGAHAQHLAVARWLITRDGTTLPSVPPQSALPGSEGGDGSGPAPADGALSARDAAEGKAAVDHLCGGPSLGKVSDGIRLRALARVGDGLLMELNALSIDALLHRWRQDEPEARAFGLAAMAHACLFMGAQQGGLIEGSRLMRVCQRSGVARAAVEALLDRVDRLEPTVVDALGMHDWRSQLRRRPRQLAALLLDSLPPSSSQPTDRSLDPPSLTPSSDPS